MAQPASKAGSASGWSSSRAVRSPRSSNPTVPSGDMAGTPLYLAPEVLAGQPASVRSDIYSLGVLLHYLATGVFPRVPTIVTGRAEAAGARIGEPSQSRADTLPSGPIAAIIARAT